MVAAAEIEGAHGFPIDTTSAEAELYSVFESVKARPKFKEIPTQSAATYYRTVVS